MLQAQNPLAESLHQTSQVGAATAAGPAPTSSIGWLRSARFDMPFVIGTAAVALACGTVAAHTSRLFTPLLLLDLWFLGYHHVVSTFTRLAMDRESRREHRFLLLQLPLMVAAVVATMFSIGGISSIVTLYFYWQWFHYARQSWGVSEAYRRKAGNSLPAEPAWLAQLIFYALPVYGVLHRSWQEPATFLGLPFKVLPVPDWAMPTLGAAACASMLWLFATRFMLWRQGRLPLAHTLYLLSHCTIFYVGYVAIADLSVGWLTVNIWHNAQYILFVWLFNNGRFKSGVRPEAKFLSHLSQRRNVWTYFAVCLAISTAVYTPLSLLSAAAPVAIVAYQILNFHHYIADSLIWKTRRHTIQTSLGIAA